MDHHFVDAAQIQPLRGEIVHERLGRARIGQHPPHLLFEDRRLGELPALGQVEQALVGNAAPQEKRQARGDFEVAQAIAAGPASLPATRVAGSRWTRSRKSGSTSIRSSAN